VEKLWALAGALGVPFSRLVDPPVAAIRVVRAGEGPRTYAEHADYAAVLLSACPPNARRDLYLASAQPGADRLSEPHLAGTVEHVVIVTGRAEVGPTGEPVELGPGDYMTYAGDVPHVFRALVPDTTAVMVSEHI